MSTVRRILALSLVWLLVGCATAAHFKLPQGTEVKFMGREQAFKAGDVTLTPFPWKAAGGIDYTIERKGKVVKTGKLPAKFRIVSIFWPPIYAIIVWPMGFGYECYDLTRGDVKQCPVESQRKKK
jgi:hypothetical protein